MPSDPNMLMSMVNMKLRDSDYSTPEELCDALSWDAAEMTRRLSEAGFTYNEDVRQYR